METFTIEDGYSQSAYIAAVPNLHPALRFKFRPMLTEDRDTITDALQSKNVAETHKTLVGAMVSRVVSWSATNSKGEPLPVDAVSIRRLRPRLFDRMYYIVTGRESGDTDPEQSDAAYRADSDAALQAAIKGTTMADVREAADEKN